MASLDPNIFDQTEKNTLSAVADAERAKLFPRNDYDKTNLYSSTNPDALADGDELGRGTGSFLDVYNDNAGTITDTVERKSEIKINKFNRFKTYPDF